MSKVTAAHNVDQHVFSVSDETSANALSVSPATFAYETDHLVCWAVRDANGNEYGTFPTHEEAQAFGSAKAEHLNLDEMRYCRVVVPAADLAKAEVCHV